jgi:ABC-type enterochelin transport system substrate-binding protein
MIHREKLCKNLYPNENVFTLKDPLIGYLKQLSPDLIIIWIPFTIDFYNKLRKRSEGCM